MIAQLLNHKLDHSHFENINASNNKRNLRSFRFYLDFKFGHGFWHSLVQSHNFIGHMYMHNYELDNKLLLELIQIVAEKVNLDKIYLLEEFNLFTFKISNNKT